MQELLQSWSLDESVFAPQVKVTIVPLRYSAKVVLKMAVHPGLETPFDRSPLKAISIGPEEPLEKAVSAGISVLSKRVLFAVLTIFIFHAVMVGIGVKLGTTHTNSSTRYIGSTYKCSVFSRTSNSMRTLIS